MTLIALGFSVGVLGTLIGAGGGFILVPILLLLYPATDNVWITSVSMFVVAMNATSGSANYYFKKRVHLKAVLVFVLASMPGSFLGVMIEPYVSREHFTFVFGCALVVYSLILFFKPNVVSQGPEIDANSVLTRKFYLAGGAISFFVGFVASFLGIGGGVIHVPLLSQVLGFPVHMATGTSHFILAVMAWFATALHLYRGDIHLSDPALWQLGLSAFVGAQIGAQLSTRVSGKVILRVLAAALFFVGLRIVWPSHFHSPPPAVSLHVQDQNGVEHTVMEFGNAKAVVLIGQGNGCPIMQKSVQKINDLVEKYSARGVKVLLINPNTEDTPDSVRTEAKDYGFHVQILLDPTQKITRWLGLTRTAEAVVLIPGSWTTAYEGAIDDELGYSVDKFKASGHFLGDALDQILAGHEVTHPREPAKGCLFSLNSEKP
jgi:uncharacterized protein